MSVLLVIALVVSLALAVQVRRLSRSLWQAQVRLARLQQHLANLARVEQASRQQANRSPSDSRSGG